MAHGVGFAPRDLPLQLGRVFLALACGHRAQFGHALLIARLVGELEGLPLAFGHEGVSLSEFRFVFGQLALAVLHPAVGFRRQVLAPGFLRVLAPLQRRVQSALRVLVP